MFTTLKRMVTFSTIAFAFTLVSAALFAIEVAKIPKLSLNLQIMYYGAIVSVPLLFLFILIGLHATYTDLMAQNDVQYQEMSDLKKKLEQLEKKVSN